jgi:hypothetical protein
VTDNRILARIARRGGGRLLNLAVERFLPEDAPPTAPSRPDHSAKPGKSLLGPLAGAAMVRLATRSVPGAIVVGGGMLAKRLYDRRRARRGKP